MSNETYGPEGWMRLGELLVERRAQIAEPKRAPFAKRNGFTNDRVLFDIEKGRRSNYDDMTLRQVEIAYKLAPGSIDNVLKGGDLEALEGVAVASAGSVLQQAAQREASVRVALSKETSEELVQGIQDRVNELRRRVDSADRLLAEVDAASSAEPNVRESQADYDLVADDAYGYSHEEEDEQREMEP